MIVIGNPAVLMKDKHWLALLMSCRNAGSVTGQPMPDLSDAASSGAQAGANGASSTGYTASNSSSSYHQSGVYTGAGGAGGSSSGRGDAISSSMQQQVVQLEKLMASISLSKAVEEVAAQTLMLEGPLGFSGLVDEVGGGMVRHE